MNWQDIGGRTKRQHVVIEWNYGIRIRILCKQPMPLFARFKIERKKPLPHCQKCIEELKKLIQESVTKYEFKPTKNFINPITG